MVTGVALSLFAVDLLQHADGLTVTFLDLVDLYIGFVKFCDIDAEEVLAACKGVLLDVLGLPAYAEGAEVLAAVERPVADSFYT